MSFNVVSDGFLVDRVGECLSPEVEEDLVLHRRECEIVASVIGGRCR